jgi:hypothetical protein
MVVTLSTNLRRDCQAAAGEVGKSLDRPQVLID